MATREEVIEKLQNMISEKSEAINTKISTIIETKKAELIQIINDNMISSNLQDRLEVLYTFEEKTESDELFDAVKEDVYNTIKENTSNISSARIDELLYSANWTSTVRDEIENFLEAKNNTEEPDNYDGPYLRENDIVVKAYENDNDFANDFLLLLNESTKIQDKLVEETSLTNDNVVFITNGVLGYYNSTEDSENYKTLKFSAYLDEFMSRYVDESATGSNIFGNTGLKTVTTQSDYIENIGGEEAIAKFNEILPYKRFRNFFILSKSINNYLLDKTDYTETLSIINNRITSLGETPIKNEFTNENISMNNVQEITKITMEEDSNISQFDIKYKINESE